MRRLGIGAFRPGSNARLAVFLPIQFRPSRGGLLQLLVDVADPVAGDGQVGGLGEGLADTGGGVADLGGGAVDVSNGQRLPGFEADKPVFEAGDEPDRFQFGEVMAIKGDLGSGHPVDGQAQAHLGPVAG